MDSAIASTVRCFVPERDVIGRVARGVHDRQRRVADADFIAVDERPPLNAARTLIVRPHAFREDGLRILLGLEAVPKRQRRV